MKRINPADVPAIQRRDKKTLELVDREGISFAEAYLRVVQEEERRAEGVRRA